MPYLALPVCPVDGGEEQGATILQKTSRGLQEKRRVIYVLQHLAGHHRVKEARRCFCRVNGACAKALHAAAEVGKAGSGQRRVALRVMPGRGNVGRARIDPRDSGSDSGYNKNCP